MTAKTTTLRWKGIVLAGGRGTRLYPMTVTASKQLLPVYDKPLIYYPISTLMLGGIRDIMIISTPQDLPRFKEMLGDGSRLGMRFSYAEQPEPRGIAEAFLIAEDFIGSSNTCLVLGDNIFYGDMRFLRLALQRRNGATVFGYPVSDPERYGVVEFDRKGKAVSIEEKPSRPRSHYAVAGLYCYDKRVVKLARKLKRSARGELEITDLNKLYLKAGDLTVQPLGRGMAWLDTGTPESLLEAASFVATVERRQGLKIGAIEEVAYRMGYLTKQQLGAVVKGLGTCSYARYLSSVMAEAETEQRSMITD